MRSINKLFGRKFAYFLIFALVVAYFGFSPVYAGTATNFKDTLSDSRPSTLANHTISFVNASSVDEGDTITLTFGAGFNMGTVASSSIDFADDGTDLDLAADCDGSEKASAAISGQVLTFTICPGDGGAMATSSVITAEIGTNATYQETGTQQITNPTAGVYNIDVAGIFGDTNRTKVAIVSGVTVTVTIPSVLTFDIYGVTGTSCPISTSIDSTATAVNFGEVNYETFYNACQRLRIGTNANDGYNVTVQKTQLLTSGSDTIPKGDCDGSCSDTTAAAWANTVGGGGAANDGFGYCMKDFLGNGAATADGAWDTNDCGDGSPYFKTVANSGAAETARTVMSSASRVVDSSYIEYRVNTSSDQPEGTYTSTIVYIATPQFD